MCAFKYGYYLSTTAWTKWEQKNFTGAQRELSLVLGRQKDMDSFLCIPSPGLVFAQ